MIDYSRILFDENVRQNYDVETIAGSDEAGRGAMAGPIVVATVILPKDYKNPLIRDSKKLAENLRESLYEEITKVAIEWRIAIYDAKAVDKLNPKYASILGMINSIQQLAVKPDICLIDGEKISIASYQTIQLIKGDDLSQTIAAASIIAKVTRDRIMRKYAKIYLQYNFDKHKGYCTKKHCEELSKYGITEIHRKSYKPVKNIMLTNK
ncbi:ribonuclease HII [Mesoplasma syrphidae]|uniref:Ribonuclease HII n=1 Tax=Mesoplasma syrphidae TaxID=225999 RepID=A0A2K9BK96_9MOLU|nr:ribonuclease HII [Mesoplasma syrphidae]AUF83651.1 ribonuclease HII [Mesoplasma syrphidae]